ncbi:MAG TPA: dephospho-CoA kinase [Candidatus Riflebacteria bacterium]|nr:dephospho-CoA kinase [Candidatus Riflebacteria bacterium]
MAAELRFRAWLTKARYSPSIYPESRNKMLVIGISGQTGAGKSTLANMLSQRGLGENVEVDAIGHELLNHSAMQHMLLQTFGAEIIVKGAVCRRTLGRLAFADKEKTQALNSIMHPAMVNEVKHKIELASAAGVTSIIINAALLFSMGLDKLCNRLVYVRANPELRLNRLVDYRQWSADSARERLYAQDEMPDNPKIIVIDNDGSEADLANAANNLAAMLLARIGENSQLAGRYPYSEIEISEGEQIIFSSPDPEVPAGFLDFLSSVFSPLDEVAAVYLFDTTRTGNNDATLVIGIEPARALASLEVDRLSFLVLEGVEAHIHDREVLDFMVIDNDDLRQIVVSVSPRIVLKR